MFAMMLLELIGAGNSGIAARNLAVIGARPRSRAVDPHFDEALSTAGAFSTIRES
jgi:hypothetical protein